MSVRAKNLLAGEAAAFETLPAEAVRLWGKTLVVAPHPDDESLGCGGAIALLRELNLEVFIATFSDGTLSHPNSRKFPPAKLRELRERETARALAHLGVPADKAFFLRYRDRSVPDAAAPAEFGKAVSFFADLLAKLQPQTILAPWRRDPHPDHRACWQITRAALDEGGGFDCRLLEYPIWLWEMAEDDDLPVEENIEIFRLDISGTIAKKQAAIRAHRSQTTNLIDDDPTGFRLSPEVLAHFAVPFETYVEEKR